MGYGIVISKTAIAAGANKLIVYLFIDEIHKYKDWSVELKNIYDFYPDLKVCFTGSSILDIRKGMADLSRRTLMFSKTRPMPLL